MPAVSYTTPRDTIVPAQPPDRLSGAEAAFRHPLQPDAAFPQNAGRHVPPKSAAFANKNRLAAIRNRGVDYG
jgi:hypothetical protein